MITLRQPQDQSETNQWLLKNYPEIAQKSSHCYSKTIPEKSRDYIPAILHSISSPEQTQDNPIKSPWTAVELLLSSLPKNSMVNFDESIFFSYNSMTMTYIFEHNEWP